LKIASSIFSTRLFCVIVGAGRSHYEIKAADTAKASSAAFCILAGRFNAG
jgi:hypothetical protein